MTTHTIPADPVRAHKVFTKIWEQVKAMTLAGSVLTVTVTDAKSRVMEAKYHSMVAEISNHIGGDLADKEDAKRILISAFRIDTRIDLADEWGKFGEARMGRGLRGEVVLLGIQSRHFSRKLASAFIEWLHAFGAEHGVRFKERVIDPDTGEVVFAK